MKTQTPKFKLGDKVRRKADDGMRVGTVKRIAYLPFSSEPCYEVEGFEIVSNGLTLPSLEAESILIAA